MGWFTLKLQDQGGFEKSSLPNNLQICKHMHESILEEAWKSKLLVLRYQTEPLHEGP